MKWIFGFVGLLITTLSSAQSNTTKEKLLLSKLQLDDSRHEIEFYRETEFGKFFTIKTFEPIVAMINNEHLTNCISKTYDTYLQVEDTIIQIESLRGYKAFDYSSEKKMLIVGRYDMQSLADSGIEELYKFDPNTKLLTKLGVYSGGVHGAEVINEKMFLLLNVRNVEGIGSHLLYVPFPID